MSEDAALLDACRAASAYSLRHDGDFMLVMRGGEVLFEEGRAPYTKRTPHALASGSKSFCGIAAALAVGDGLLDLDERVSDTIQEWRDDPKRREITVRQLLSLAAGLESLGAKIDNPRNAKAAGISDRAAASVAARLLAEPGSRFIYGPSSFYVFGELMKRKLRASGAPDGDMADYLKRRIFTPLGIAPVVMRDETDNPNFAGGVRLCAEDWARFGLFVLDGGRWNGMPLVDPKVLAEVLSPHGPNPRYGLSWWLLRGGADGANPEDELAPAIAAERLAPEESDGLVRRAIRERLASAARDRAEDAQARASTLVEQPIDGFMAAGKGKQRLYVLPAQGLVIVRFGLLTGSEGFHDAEFLGRIVPVASTR
ncbi:MAG: beta-lactamase family protein [Planctomycetaceae bacterium]|nr:beta-lactamase family protein [Planctomycetaceae bacterium]